ncbi:hypothetical protein PVL29_001111 [Vitis rotundifolia]|uniref:Uncharacterized protein n=1 Tax=Vitis rotundifolia TaxID=103349 RepID=A0AA39AKR4_VITRO|nr:hypothetical protein PVL29_001111 [Vitis rotundifolia]
MGQDPKGLVSFTVESLEIISIPAIQTIILKSIFFISLAVASILMVLPSEQIDGNAVFALSGAFAESMMESQSKIARFCSYYSIPSMASDISVLMFAIFLQVG